MKVVLKILNQSRTVQRIGGKRNANRNQTVRLENRLKDKFVSKNIVNLCKRNVND